MKQRILFIALVSFIIVNLNYGSGFQINESGAKAMAMAGAFAGVANDASAIHFNPAGITQLQGTNISAGVSLIIPSFKYTSPDGNEYEIEKKVFTPFNVYITHQFSEKFSAGFGVNTPYGLGTFWEDEEWPGRYLALDTEIRTFVFTPVIAYKVSDAFSISAGLRYGYGDVLISRKTAIVNPSPPAYLTDGLVELEGDGTALGFVAGILVKPSEMIQLGLSYRSEMNYTFEGDAVNTIPAPYNAAIPSTALPYGPISADLTTPQNITFGVGIMPNEAVTISADFQYVGWSSYDKLEIDFDDWANPLTGEQRLSSERNFENSFIARLGAEYKASEQFALRGGLLYDNNPVTDEMLEPTLPDADRIGLNIGLGYQFTENLSMDLAYFLLIFNERQIEDSEVDQNPSPLAPGIQPFNGTYNSTAHLFGINLNYAIN